MLLMYPMKANLSIKEAKFLEKYLSGASLETCAKYAGFKGTTKHSMQQLGYLCLKNLDISMEETLDRIGVTDEKLARRLDEALSAKKCYYGSFQGQILKSAPYEDIPSRLKAVELAGRMKAHFVDRTELTGKDAGELVLQVMTRASKKKDKGTVDL